jgi:hypothetical protein
MQFAQLTFLFATSESDSESIFRDAAGKYYSKRYGLPIMEIKKEWAETQAWFQCNRLGRFEHLAVRVPGEIPQLTNPDAQAFIVNVMMKTLTINLATNENNIHQPQR